MFEVVSCLCGGACLWVCVFGGFAVCFVLNLFDSILDSGFVLVG